MNIANLPNYDPMNDRAAKSSRFGPKLALVIGFGGVLALMAVAGIDSIRVLHRLERTDSELTRTYVAKYEALTRIRSAVYESGNLVRDYLLAKSEDAATGQVARLRAAQREMATAFDEYSQYVGPSERKLYHSLEEEVGLHWKILLPILEWSPEEKLARGQDFLVEEAPHRKKLAEVVDKIDAVNRQVVDSSNAHSAELFDSFRLRMAVVLALALGLGLILAAFSISHISRLETAARLRYEEILRARTELESLSAKLVDTQEDERRAISRELHDEVGQSLSALLVDLGNLSAVVHPGSPEIKKHLKTAKQLAESTLASVRNMALLLRPSMLDDLGLVPALHWQAREVSRRAGIKVEVNADCIPDELPDEHRTCVFRVVQEALHNTTRHAAARTVTITATLESGRLVLNVQDDGQGFDIEKTRGMGLLSMEERVRHLGGKLHISSRPGGGTTILIELPFEYTLA